MSLGIANYTTDFREATPSSATIVGSVGWGNAYGSGWVTGLARQSYVPSTATVNRAKKDAFACPVDTLTTVDHDGSAPYYSSYKGLSYFWTADLPGGPVGDTMFNNNTPLTLRQLELPAMEQMPGHNPEDDKAGAAPRRFPTIIEDHFDGGVTRDPRGYPYNASFQRVPHREAQRAAIMNDLSVTRMEAAFDHPDKVAPVRFYFPGNGM